ncbi:MAG: rod shape-determining protein MreD [Prevotella sp.]|nr:rod shape-determining protein MreD [Prevotella sp.]
MSIDFFKTLLLFVVFSLAQVLVLNHIHLFGFATPLLYVYFVLMFQRNYPQWAILLWSFAMGLLIDTFSNTPGVTAASLTLAGCLQPYLLAPFIPRDSAADLKPMARTLGVAQFLYYSFIMVLIYNVVFFSLEMFSFSNWLYWLECIGGSTLLTLVLIMVLETIRRK